MSERTINKDKIKPTKIIEGVYRKTLAYNDSVMLCHFLLEKDAKIPLHNHKELQIGYVINGKIKFLTENGDFIATTGDSYVFDSSEKHGAILLEKSEIIEVFHPLRDDYK
ncbi:MAG: cupin domain-containing protein [Candidatus Lokiarchaeia archaeon]|nr:cupin domain-containing protein [Candidatus Lokiarchaeia archaeon]